ncbi:hypothetical protein FRB90_004540 [Tulasnella sp. 427]|nr:hypothetical protein FRB90_004540 [Tulasnella sp. 427]
MPPKSGSSNPLTSLVKKLATSPNAFNAKLAADNLARAIPKQGLASLVDATVLKNLSTYATSSKAGERMAAAVGYTSLVTVLGPSVLPAVLPSLSTLLDMQGDGDNTVANSAKKAVESIVSLVPVEAIPQLAVLLVTELKAIGKWQAKVGCLKELARLVDLRGQESKDEVASILATLLPDVEHAMHDTKKEVSAEAIATATALCSTLPNPDLLPHVQILIESMKAPTTVPQTIKALSNTTFVTEVTPPSLAVLIPLLQRGLNDRSMDVQRRTVIIVENVCKLVRDPLVAAQYLKPLVDGVEKIRTGASFPEVRAFAQSAYDTLIKAGAGTEIKSEPRDLDTEAKAVELLLLPILPNTLIVPSPNNPAGPGTPFHPLFAKTLEYSSRLVAELVYRNAFTGDDHPKWVRCLGVFVSGWSEGGNAKSQSFAEEARKHFLAIELAKNSPDAAQDGSEDVLIDTIFSLAYGALLLLSHTRLRLVRGRRYGICASNGSGKSTLLRAIRDGKVENFPPQDEVRAVMVEHALQGEDRSLSIIDFIAADKQLEGVSRELIRDQLLAVGFDDDRQAQTVGSLSGGWKMKLELARAMLYKADVLLLDEPTNHLDVASVKWLEEWLLAQKNVTCLIVSHDSGFLDNVTTDIIHYESKKLVYYPGPLRAFVEKVPSAKSYYTLAATSIRFSFPPPGSLMGVRSNTRAILKIKDCTYTYPGRDKPSLVGVSCALSLSSRVGIVGPNGAGKSTLIKVLTGEAIPQEGTVYKHPALRVGYVAQHATHHIEQHLEKTPVGYIQWRFQAGHDKEILEKVTRVLTPEEKELLDKDWVIMGRQKLKKSYQYEIKWRGLDHKFNTWVPREDLLERGFTKLVQQFDDLESSREGAGSRETTLSAVRKHLEEVGLDGDIAQYNEMSGLSGGQKMKVVIAAALWNNPQIVVLDEVTNFLDREAVGGVAVAIREWAGAVCIISHNMEFVNALCPEIWNVESGRLVQQGKSAVVEDAFLETKSKPASRLASRKASPAITPSGSNVGTPAGSGDEATPEGASTPSKAGGLPKKKKLTRNQLKAKEERRRQRKLQWLITGGPKPDSDSDPDPPELPRLQVAGGTRLATSSAKNRLFGEIDATRIEAEHVADVRGGGYHNFEDVLFRKCALMDTIPPRTVAALAAALSTGWILYKVLSIGKRETDLPPGPKTVPVLGNLLDFPKVNAHEAFSKWARIYGDIFSFKVGSSNLIVLTSPQAVREVLDKQSAITSDRPPMFIADVITDGNHLPFVRQGPTWKILRRTVRDILSPQACARHSQMQGAESARLMYDLLRQPDDHYLHYQRYALSVIMSVTFGQSAPSLTSPSTQTFIKNAHDFNHIMGPGATPPLDLLPALKYIPESIPWWVPLPASVKETIRASWKEVCRDIRARHKVYYSKLLKPCQDRAKEGLENRSFMQSVCEKQEESGMSEEMTLLLGQAILETGSDTSGAYLQNATLLLAAHPEVQKKAQEELDRVVGSERTPKMEDMERLPYIRAIIEEVHRMRPVAPMAIPHHSTSDLSYRNYSIPANTMLIPNVYGIFSSPLTYDSPEKFDPDRYLRHPLGIGSKVDPKENTNLKDFVYGFGKRSCPGIILAKTTICINISSLLWGFDILKKTGPDGNPIEPDVNATKPQLVLVTPPFPADIRPRSRKHAEIITQNFIESTPVCLPFEQELTLEDQAFVKNLRDDAAQYMKTLTTDVARI